MTNSLLDTMFIKRFCLPSNTNIEKYENFEGKITTCVCSHYNHIACVFEGKPTTLEKARILSFGTNMMGDINGTIPGIHAEHNALTKLKPIKYKKKLEQINILVIRVSKTNKIQSSKPCNNCIRIMELIPERKGYKIQNIYYSNEEGNIIKTTLNILKNEEQHYSRYYRYHKI